MATIEKRNGSYRITVSCGYDIYGKQIKQRTTYTPDTTLTPAKAKKDLEKFVIEFENSVKSGKILNSTIKFEALAREWLNDKKIEGKLKPLTIERYEQLQERTYKAIGHKKISDIHYRDIKDFIYKISDEGYSTKTQSLYKGFISDVFKYAILCGYVTANPCDNVQTVKKPPKERDVYSPEETAAFLLALEAAPITYKLYFTIALYLGLRNGEILGLEWKDIDYDKRTITINRISSHKLGEGMITGTPKTKKSNRTISIPDILINLLKEYKVYQNAERLKCGDRWVDMDRLFTAWNGTPMGENTARHWLKNFCEQNNIRYLGIHSFRHFFASLLVAGGTNVKAVSSILGHSQTSTTLNIYSHSFEETETAAIQGAANVLEELKTKAN